ncbi:hypothetical protein RV11_GL003138 [Enterococcus phoeniculicola]|nr:hypothetical protein RV11_GL003138 [Enterococcus phoeniculicola]
MYVSSSTTQATSVTTMCKSQIEGYNELQKAITNFVIASPFLSGQAYDSAKAYFQSVLSPLAQGGILLSEAVERAVKKFPEEYMAQVDSGDLKQSELEEAIRQTDKLLQQAEDIRRTLTSSKTPDSTKLFQLTTNLMLIGLYSTTKQKLEEQLRKLLAFHASSPAIFSEISTLQSAVNQGLAQATTAWNGATGTFTVPTDLSWKNTITDNWKLREEKEQERLKQKIKNQNLPTTKAEILRDYHWSTNSNMYVHTKTGVPSPEVTALYNKLTMEEHAPQKNPQLEFFNEMLRTGKHPITGEQISKAERVNAKLMIYSLVLQPFVGAWAISKIPQNQQTSVKGNSNVKTDFSAENPVSGNDWNNYFEDKYGAGNVQWKNPVSSISELMENPSSLINVNPADVADFVKREGWMVTPLKKGGSGGIPYEEGGGFSMNPPKGTSGGSRYIQYHPGNGHHGEVPYYKISQPNKPTVRIYMDGRYEID